MVIMPPLLGKQFMYCSIWLKSFIIYPFLWNILGVWVYVALILPEIKFPLRQWLGNNPYLTSSTSIFNDNVSSPWSWCLRCLVNNLYTAPFGQIPSLQAFSYEIYLVYVALVLPEIKFPLRQRLRNRRYLAPSTSAFNDNGSSLCPMLLSLVCKRFYTALFGRTRR